MASANRIEGIGGGSGRGTGGYSYRGSELSAAERRALVKQNKSAESLKNKDLDKMDKNKAAYAKQKEARAKQLEGSYKVGKRVGATKGLAAGAALGAVAQAALDKAKASKKAQAKPTPKPAAKTPTPKFTPPSLQDFKKSAGYKTNSLTYKEYVAIAQDVYKAKLKRQQGR